jgi:hypothetical protein
MLKYIDWWSFIKYHVSAVIGSKVELRFWEESSFIVPKLLLDIILWGCVV